MVGSTTFLQQCPSFFAKQHRTSLVYVRFVYGIVSIIDDRFSLFFFFFSTFAGDLYDFLTASVDLRNGTV